MSNFSMLQKQEYCKELDDFTENTETYLREICSYLDWDIDKIGKNDETYIVCPFNKAHRVPERTIEKHLEKCEWNILGYTKNCIPLSEPTLQPKNPSTIKFDMQLQHKILQSAKQKNPEFNIGVDEKLIPQTSERLLSDFTNDERKAMYEYVISNTVGPDIGQDITDVNKPQKTNEQSTPIIELLAQERNLKRRRTKHRGLHTNKKSHIEILRELVQQQMEMYKEHISEKFGIPISESTEENCCHSKDNENEIFIDKDSEYSIFKHNKKDLLENSQFHYHKTKQNSKIFNEKIKIKSKHDKDYNTKYKHSSHQKNYDYKSSSKDQNHQIALLRHDYHDKDHDKYIPFDKDNRQYQIQSRIHNKSDIYDKNRDFVEFHHRKRDRSKSSEKKWNEKSRHNSQEQRHYKKHKKTHKKKRESYSCNKDERKYKSSTHKRDKYNKNQTEDP